MRFGPLFSMAFVLGLTTAAAQSAAADASTTRIEPRPFYGATVSIEAGVRVFRPLPPHKNIIINPGNKTPLNVMLKDVTENRNIKSENNYYDRSGGQTSSRGNDNFGNNSGYYGGGWGGRGNGRWGNNRGNYSYNTGNNTRRYPGRQWGASVLGRGGRGGGHGGGRGHGGGGHGGGGGGGRR